VLWLMLLALVVLLTPAAAFAGNLSSVAVNTANNYVLPDNEGNYTAYPLTTTNIKSFFTFNTTVSAVYTQDGSSAIHWYETSNPSTQVSVSSATYTGSTLTVQLNTSTAMTKGVSYTLVIPAGTVTFSDATTWPAADLAVKIIPSVISTVVPSIAPVPTCPQVTLGADGTPPSVGANQPEFTLNFSVYPDMVDGDGHAVKAKLDDLAHYFELVDLVTGAVYSFNGDDFNFIIKTNPSIVEKQKIKVRLPKMIVGDTFALRIKQNFPYYLTSDYTDQDYLKNAVDIITFKAVDMAVSSYTIDGATPADPITNVSLYPVFNLTMSQPVSYYSTSALAHLVDVSGVRPTVDAYIWYKNWHTYNTKTNYQSGSIEVKPFTYLFPATTYRLVLPADIVDPYGSYLGEDMVVATFTTTETDFAGRSFENPIAISNADELYNIRNSPDWEKKYYVLTADIDLNDLIDSYSLTSSKNWTPFPDTKMFTGGIDGQGHKIKNMTCSSTSSGFGLFASLGISGKAASVPNYTPGAYKIKSEIKNITFTDVNITSSSANKGVGALAALTGNNFVEISNCHLVSENTNNGVVIGSFVKGPKFVGGLVGQAGMGTAFTGCSVTDLTVNGYNLTATNNTDFGGLVGCLDYNSAQPGAVERAKITDCRVTNLNITANSAIGGLVGTVKNGCPITNCSVDKAVLTATYYASTSDYDAVAGGMVGNTNGSINDSTVTDATINGLSYLGGLAGKVRSQLYTPLAVCNFNDYLNKDNLQTVISGCSVDNVQIYSTNSGVALAKPTDLMTYNRYIGGLVASSTGVAVSDCSVNDSYIDGLKNVGGFIGYGERYCYNGGGQDTVSGLDTTLENCTVADTNVSLPNYIGTTIPDGLSILGYNVGGFAGHFAFDEQFAEDSETRPYDSVKAAKCSVRNVVVTDQNVDPALDVVIDLKNVGGFVGANQGVIDSCKVKGGSVTTTDSIVAGFVGVNNGGIIRNSATTAHVTGADTAGAFSARTAKVFETINVSPRLEYLGPLGSYENCYYLEQPYVGVADEAIVTQPDGITETLVILACDGNTLDVGASKNISVALNPAASLVDFAGVLWSASANGQINSSSVNTEVTLQATNTGAINISADIDGRVKTLTLNDGMKGDVSGDNIVDVMDLVRTLNIALEKIEPTDEQRFAADANSDGIVNVLDVVNIVNIILGQAS